MARFLFFIFIGDAVKGCLGKYPRLVIILILLIIQGTILIVVNNIEIQVSTVLVFKYLI